MLEELDPILHKFGEYYVKRAKEEFEKRRSTGVAERSISYEVEDNKVIISAIQHAFAVSRGIKTGPSEGKKDSFKDMINNIIEWMSTKRMSYLARGRGGRFRKDSMNTRRMAAYAIARSIRTKGILKEFGYQGTRVFEIINEEAVRKFGDEFIQVLENEIDERLRKDFLIDG